MLAVLVVLDMAELEDTGAHNYWKPKYRVLANSANRVNERVSVPVQMALPFALLI